jgi:hypothetical protein
MKGAEKGEGLGACHPYPNLASNHFGDAQNPLNLACYLA